MDRGATESDARLERMDRVGILYGEINAATREFLRAVAECDRHRDWAEAGFASCVDWLAWRIGVSRMTASEKVRAARALEDLPLISEAMGRGELSFTKVRALTRVATPESEAELLDYARANSAASLERLVRGWRTMDRAGEQRVEQLRHRLRSFSVFPDREGMYLVRGRLTPEVAAVLMRAVEAASDALSEMGASSPANPAASARSASRPTASARRCFGSGRSSSAAGFRAAPCDGSPPGPPLPPPPSTACTRAERYQVLLLVEPETLRAEGEPGMSELADGTRFSAGNSRRLACDASVVEVVKGPDGSVLDVGRRRRTVPPGLRRALEARDRGCRFPGCGLRFTDAHHLEHWADGGATSMKNTVLLCRRHHTLVHEGGHRVCSDAAGQVVFFAPSGKPIAASVPPPTPAADPLDALFAGNRARGVEPDWRCGLPRPHRGEHQVPARVDAA